MKKQNRQRTAGEWWRKATIKLQYQYVGGDKYMLCELKGDNSVSDSVMTVLLPPKDGSTKAFLEKKEEILKEFSLDRKVHSINWIYKGTYLENGDRALKST